MPDELTLEQALGGAQLPADAGQLEAEIQNKTEEFKEAPVAPEEVKEPETPAELRRQQCVGIGTDRIESGVAEIEQASEADDDVQAPAEHHVDQHIGAEIERDAVGERQERHDDGEEHAGGHQPCH